MKAKSLRWLAIFISRCWYWIDTKKRHTGLSNLDLVYGDSLCTSEKKRILKGSLENFALNFLELLFDSRPPQQKVIWHPNSVSFSLNEKYLFFSGHLGNWEGLGQLLGSLFPNGYATAKRAKPKWLYEWIIKKRLRFGGNLVHTEKGISKLMKCADHGLLMFADQATLKGDYNFPLLGRKARLSSLPALVAYKKKRPIHVVTALRKDDKLEVCVHPPIYPDLSLTMKESIPKLMDEIYRVYECEIRKAPEQFFWAHDQWKLEKAFLKKKKMTFREVHLVFPKGKSPEKQESVVQSLYPHAYTRVLFGENEAFAYQGNGAQLVFDFTGSKKLKRLYKKQYNSIVHTMDAGDFPKNRDALHELCLEIK